MNYFKIATAQFRNKFNQKLVSILLVACAIVIVSSINHLVNYAENKMIKNAENIDAVVGANGSPMQLVLCNVFHADFPTGNIPLKVYNDLSKNPLLEIVTPLSLGDTYKNWRIAGTDSSIMALYKADIYSGSFFSNEMEVMIGSEVSSLTNVKIGDEIISSHGLSHNGEALHSEDKLTVVGVMKTTGTELDKLILCSIGTYDHLHNIESADQQITSIMVKFRSPLALFQLRELSKTYSGIQMVIPALEIYKIMNIAGTGKNTLVIIGFIMMLLSGLSLIISLVNIHNQRKHEMYLMRMLGSPAKKIILPMTVEGILVCISGYTVGICSTQIFLYILPYFVDSQMLNDVEMGINSYDLYLLPVILACGTISALIPAISTYRKSVYQNL